MGQLLRVLLVEDSEDDALLVLRELKRGGYEPISERVDTPEAMSAALAKEWDLIISDYVLPGFDGIGALRVMKERGVEFPFIVSSGKADEETLVAAMKAGAQDYIRKGNLSRLGPAVERELREAMVRRERKKAEEALRQSEQFSREVISGARDGIIVYDRQFRYRVWNPFMKTLTGISASEALGKYALDLFPHLREHRVDALLERALAGETVQSPDTFYQVPQTRRSGWVSAIYSPYHDANGEIIGVIGIVRDITERKAAQEAIRKSEEKYRTLVENANDAIFIAQDETLKFANRKTQEMLESSAEELARIPFEEFIHPEDRGMVLERRRRRQAGEELPGAYSFRVITKTNRELWVELNAVLIEWEQKPATLNFARDITEQKQLEAKLLHTQKMEAVGQLAGGIAHDFNNSLTLISVCSQMALMELEPESPVREKLETIYAATERSAHLSRQLLVFSRRQVMEMKVLDLNLLLKDLEKMLSWTIGDNIQLNLFLDKDLGFIETDPGQVEQAVVNLAVNARDAMPDGGSLAIETANANLDRGAVRERPGMIPGSYVMLRVSDTGMGMSPEVARRIFEPFFTTKGKEKGTGLGLSMVYGIVKQSRGYIYVNSKPGAGATFEIYLPRVDKPAEGVEPKVLRKEELPRGGETVLVAEDVKPIRVFVAQVLRKQGYNVVEASGSGEAFLLTEKSQKEIDLLLTDVIMPGMSGPELADRLRAIHPEMKVLYMSGYPDETIARHGVLKSGVSFLQKPFTIEDLLAKVRKVLGQGPPKPQEEQIKLF